MLVSTDWRAADVLDAVADRVPRQLVRSEALLACREIAAKLPRLVASQYLECRLGADDQVDYLASLAGVHGDMASLQVLAPRRTNNLLADMRRDPALRLVEYMWLEYDSPSHAPSLSLLVDRDYFRRQFSARPNDPACAVELTRALLAHCLEAEVAARHSAAVARCVERLPEAGRLIYVSPMLARVPCVTKLYLVLPKQHVHRYLDSIDWQGDRVILQRLLLPYTARVADSVYVDLTLAPEVLPRIGIAMSQLQAAELHGLEDTWSWIPSESMQPHKLASLECWPAITRCTIAELRTWVRCWLDIKAVISDLGQVCAKAYLGVMAQHPPRLGAWEQA